MNTSNQKDLVLEFDVIEPITRTQARKLKKRLKNNSFLILVSRKNNLFNFNVGKNRTKKREKK